MSLNLRFYTASEGTSGELEVISRLELRSGIYTRPHERLANSVRVANSVENPILD